jgi:hypothetical protein
LASFRNEGVRPAGGIRHSAAQKGKLLLEVCHFALCSPSIDFAFSLLTIAPGTRFE